MLRKIQSLVQYLQRWNRTTQVHSKVKSWRKDVRNSESVSTQDGLRSLTQCDFIDAAVDSKSRR